MISLEATIKLPEFHAYNSKHDIALRKCNGKWRHRNLEMLKSVSVFPSQRASQFESIANLLDFLKFRRSWKLRAKTARRFMS